MWNSGRVAAAAAALTVAGALAISGPAQAAPSSWSVVNGAATAAGTLDHRATTGGRYADVVGTITVGDTDGQCYYLRYYVQADVLGSGFNSPRQCSEGVLPVRSQAFLSTFLTRGFRFGLCRVAPGTPDESPLVGLGTHCAAA